MGKIYYAHHLWKYNTPIEEYELNLIKRYFPYHEIINPKGYIVEPNLNNEGITIRKRYKDDCFKKVCKNAIKLLEWAKSLD